MTSDFMSTRYEACARRVITGPSQHAGHMTIEANIAITHKYTLFHESADRTRKPVAPSMPASRELGESSVSLETVEGAILAGAAGLENNVSRGHIADPSKPWQRGRWRSLLFGRWVRKAFHAEEIPLHHCTSANRNRTKASR